MSWKRTWLNFQLMVSNRKNSTIFVWRHSSRRQYNTPIVQRDSVPTVISHMMVAKAIAFNAWLFQRMIIPTKQHLKLTYRERSFEKQPNNIFTAIIETISHEHQRNVLRPKSVNNQARSEVGRVNFWFSKINTAWQMVKKNADMTTSTQNFTIRFYYQRTNKRCNAIPNAFENISVYILNRLKKPLTWQHRHRTLRSGPITIFITWN